MKKSIFLGMLAALALANSCSTEDNGLSSSENNLKQVTLKVSADGALTRAISDGTSVDQLVYRVFDKNGNAITTLNKTTETAADLLSGHTVTLTLAKGQTYKIAFWAQKADCAAYTVDDKMNVSIDYSGVNNDESRDAFFKTVELTVNEDMTQDVTLKRPFAQINGTVSGATDVTYTEANLPGEPLMVDADGDGTKDSYKYLSMCYVLPNDATDGTQKTLASTEFTFKPAAGTDVIIKDGLQNVPLQRNYRTNIVGDILTRSQQFKIVVDPAFDEPDNNVVYRIAKASTQAEMTAAAAQPNTTVVLEPNTYTLSAAPADGVVFTSNNPETTIIRIPAAVTATNVKFENVTVESPNTTYTGIQHATSVRYTGCIITGQPFSYAADAYYDNCTFKQTSADAYNIWTYGSTRITFNKCKFQCAGKSVLIYNEGSVSSQTATFNDCTFKASAPATGKAAIEIDSSLPAGVGTPFNVIINNCTATGFDNGSVSGNPLWNEKRGTKAQVTVDGVVVKERQ